MPNHEVRTLPIAVRVFPDPASAEGEARSGKFWQEPEGILWDGLTHRRNC